MDGHEGLGNAESGRVCVGSLTRKRWEVNMRKTFFVLALTVALLIAMTATALAHPFAGDACDAGMPGHSEYAQNHIAHAAQEGGIIGHVHKPGQAHHGWAGLCGVQS